jgi:hypothetical protein
MQNKIVYTELLDHETNFDANYLFFEPTCTNNVQMHTNVGPDY